MTRFLGFNAKNPANIASPRLASAGFALVNFDSLLFGVTDMTKAEMRAIAAQAVSLAPVVGASIKIIPVPTSRKSRVLARITYVAKYADGSRAYYSRDARSLVHKCN